MQLYTVLKTQYTKGIKHSRRVFVSLCQNTKTVINMYIDSVSCRKNQVNMDHIQHIPPIIVIDVLGQNTVPDYTMWTVSKNHQGWCSHTERLAQFYRRLVSFSYPSPCSFYNKHFFSVMLLLTYCKILGHHPNHQNHTSHLIKHSIKIINILLLSAKIPLFFAARLEDRY